LKRFLLIASFIVTTCIAAQAQTRPVNDKQPTVQLRFYPNPATSVVTFDFIKGYETGYALQVYNFLGRRVHESKNIPQKTSIQLTDYSRGIYIYQLVDRNGKVVESGKFQVSR
jgi:hypothetical protein